MEDVVTVVAAIEAEVDGLADDAFDRPLVPYVWNISRNKKSQPMGGRCALGDDPADPNAGVLDQLMVEQSRPRLAT